MAADALETLHQVNDFLRSTLTRLRPERRHCSTIRPQDFSDILGQLLRAAECLRRPPVSSDDAAAFEQESLAYRGNLEKLKRFLPDLQVRLLAEKSRLENARAHAAAAAAWAQSHKKTL
ncbi:MAG: hypothetical protein ABSD75_30660 [Terriglobales bacterium]